MRVLPHSLKARCSLLLSSLFVCAGMLSLPAMADDVSLGKTLSKIRDRGYFYVGYRASASPFSYQLAAADGQSAVAGYTWEICGHVVKAVEDAVGKPFKVVPVPVSLNNRLMLVKSGMADIECGATSNLSSRQKLVTFSNTYFVAEVKVVAPADGAVRSLNDLANKRVVAIAGTSATRLIRQAAFARGLPVDVLEVRSAEDAFAALQSGKVDAYVGDDAIINQQRSEASNPGAFAILSESLSVEPYGLVLPLEDENFRRLVNQVLTGLMASGELERIYDKWFMSPIPPKGVALNMPISPMLKSVIQYPNDRPATY